MPEIRPYYKSNYIYGLRSKHYYYFAVDEAWAHKLKSDNFYDSNVILKWTRVLRPIFILIFLVSLIRATPLLQHEMDADPVKLSIHTVSSSTCVPTLDNLARQQTFREVPVSEAQGRILDLMWVLDYKYSEEGYLERYKARLVVRGDQIWWSHGDTYAATLASNSFRLLLAVIAYFNLEADQLDVVFLPF